MPGSISSCCWTVSWAGILPVRFIAFALVGVAGMVVHMAVLAILFKSLELSFVVAQAGATLVAMTGNFALNNVLTHSDMRLRGRRWLTGWLSFSIARSVGALANIGIAGWLFERQPNFWVPSALAGILVAAVWNYAVTQVYTWKNRELLDRRSVQPWSIKACDRRDFVLLTRLKCSV